MSDLIKSCMTAALLVILPCLPKSLAGASAPKASGLSIENVTPVPWKPAANRVLPMAGSRDGKHILVVRSHGDRVFPEDLYLLALDTRRAVLLVSGAQRGLCMIRSAVFGPDDKRVYFVAITYVDSLDWETNLESVAVDGSDRRVEASLGPGCRIRGMAWSPDGKRLAIARRRHPAGKRYFSLWYLTIWQEGKLRDVVTIDSMKVAPLKPSTVFQPSWLSDDRVLFNSGGVSGLVQKYYLMQVRLDETGAKPTILRRAAPKSTYLTVSPDGQWLAYTTSGVVMLAAFPSGEPTRVSDGWVGDQNPWMGRGKDMKLLIWRYITDGEGQGPARERPFVVDMEWSRVKKAPRKPNG